MVHISHKTDIIREFKSHLICKIQINYISHILRTATKIRKNVGKPQETFNKSDHLTINRTPTIISLYNDPALKKTGEVNQLSVTDPEHIDTHWGLLSTVPTGLVP